MTEQEFNEKLQKAKVLFDEKINVSAEKSVPFANYVASKKSGNTIYISGQLPRDLLDGNKVIIGKADNNNNIFDAKYAAAMCAMQVLLVLKNEIGDLKKVKSCVQLQVFVNSAPDFINQHLVANGASDLVCEYLEKSIAQHTRCAVGVATLPLGALVEVGAVFEMY
jgi:enamine deaminase RidA (YjgF/YER057c/UK114 family)